MRFQELFEGMSYNEAYSIVTRAFGADPSTLTDAERNKKFRAAVMQMHPDRGGDAEQMKQFNAAYDMLKKNDFSEVGSPNGGSRSGAHQWDDWSGHSYGSSYRRPEPEGTPPWAWAGYSGGIAPSGRIDRNDYTDVNFIKKRMWELSGHSNEEWTIWGHDGAYFRACVVVYGSPKIFGEMAKAVYDWQTKGGNPYRCRAIFVHKKGWPNEKLDLIWADGQSYANHPIEMEHDSFNGNPGNDQSFNRYIPEFLDKLRDEGRTDYSGTQGDLGLSGGGKNYRPDKPIDTGTYVKHSKFGIGQVLNPNIKKGYARVFFPDDGRTGNVKRESLTPLSDWEIKHHKHKFRTHGE